jgi:hypothetical protein
MWQGVIASNSQNYRPHPDSYPTPTEEQEMDELTRVHLHSNRYNYWLSIFLSYFSYVIEFNCL